MINTYEVKPHQKDLAKKIDTLNKNRIYNLVVQQNYKKNNLTLNQLKKGIKDGIKAYSKDFFGYRYRNGLEDNLIKYLCVFETNSSFNKSQFCSLNIDTGLNYYFHFHLFISSEFTDVYIPYVIFRIIDKLSSFKSKEDSLLKIDYVKLNNFNNDFSFYHTKTFQNQNEPQLILTNV